MNLAIGRSGFLLLAIVSTWNRQTESYESGEIRAELITNHSDINESQGYFALLQRQKDDTESEFGQPFEWDMQADRKTCRIVIRQDADINNHSDWDRQHRWLIQTLDRMHNIFAHRVKLLSLDEPFIQDIVDNS